MTRISYTSRHHTPSTSGARGKTRLRSLAVIGVLFATILMVSGCCAGVCRPGPPPIGAGVQQHGSAQVEAVSRA
jgi:hypothetical protein